FKPSSGRTDVRQCDRAQFWPSVLRSEAEAERLEGPGSVLRDGERAGHAAAFAAAAAGAVDAGEAGVEIDRQPSAVERVAAAAQRDVAREHDHTAVEVVDPGRAA